MILAFQKLAASATGIGIDPVTKIYENGTYYRAIMS
jgi:hypothetical protein